MSDKKKKLLWLIALIILLVVVLAVAIYQHAISFQWDTTAFWISADSTVERSFPIAIQGKIRDKDGHFYLFLDLDLPDDFRYSAIGDESGIPIFSAAEFPELDADDWYTSDFCYDKENNDISTCYIAINKVKGYFLIYCREENTYLVAAADPDTDPAVILDHFSTYIEIWSDK